MNNNTKGKIPCSWSAVIGRLGSPRELMMIEKNERKRERAKEIGTSFNTCNVLSRLPLNTKFNQKANEAHHISLLWIRNRVRGRSISLFQACFPRRRESEESASSGPTGQKH